MNLAVSAATFASQSSTVLSLSSSVRLPDESTSMATCKSRTNYKLMPSIRLVVVLGFTILLLFEFTVKGIHMLSPGTLYRDYDRKANNSAGTYLNSRGQTNDNDCVTAYKLVARSREEEDFLGGLCTKHGNEERWPASEDLLGPRDIDSVSILQSLRPPLSVIGSIDAL